MIYVVVTAAHRYTIDDYLAEGGAPVADCVQSVSHECLLAQDVLPAGVYIFADLERVPPREAEQLAVVWQALADAGLPLLNHPTRSMRRYELLRQLREAGINLFDALRVTDGRWPARYPVFLRREHDHDGARSDLLADRTELERALADLDRSGHSREDTLIIEFCDTKDARGVYRKYSSFICGARVIPRHLFFGKRWMLKHGAGQLPDQASLDEERTFIENNPHADEIRAIFQFARISYGRIDYSLYDGRIQVWEINTNPYVETFDGPTKEERRFLSEMFYRRLNESLRAIDVPMPRAMVRIRREGPARKIVRVGLQCLGLRAYAGSLLTRLVRIKRALDVP